ncbi:MAG: 2-oxoacid:acceptor oxidoreductase subunit alpha [Desulfurococcales archaeon]|nr:2-oxoacid:acceptor oxidoreductase subunit alpha [Desulfurococcales archaeon]
MTDLNIIIGGPQGGGIESAGQIAVKSLVLKGYNILGSREYHSNIMGAHSYYHLRAKEDKPGSLTLPVDALLALDAETVLTHYREVRPGGIVVYDPAVKATRVDSIQPMAPPLKERVKKDLESRGLPTTAEGALKAMESEGVKLVGLPLKAMLRKVSEEAKAPIASVSKTVNTLGLSAMLYMLGVEPGYIEKAISLQFAGKEKVIRMNVAAARIAVEYVREVYGEPEVLPDGPHKGKVRMVASGNDLVAMGKIVAGVGFLSYYPITPSSDEALYLERHKYVKLDDGMAEKVGYDRLSVVAVQMEDELASINAAIGAALAGARSSTTTSGPGYSLMNEGISLAVEAEVPIVVTLWMRAGPSTGMPTRTGQQDLLHSIFSGHGDAPKIVIASGDHVEAFYDAIKAFNWAEIFQSPVIHLLDKYLASAMASLDREELDLSKVVIDRGKLVDNPGEGYLRYKITEDGISPRARIGDAVMYMTGLEHTEDGKATEDPVAREQMMFKRERKMRKVLEVLPEEDKAVLYGDPDADVTLVSFGSTKGVILDAMKMLEGKGVKANFLQIRLLSPFPEDLVADILSSAKKVITVELNLMGQLAFLLRAHTGVKPDSQVIKVNGRPIYDYEVVEGVLKALDGAGRVVVSGGS